VGGGAPRARAATHSETSSPTPHIWQLVACQARLRRRIQTDTRSPGWPRMRPTHAHRRAGAAYSGCADDRLRSLTPSATSDNWSAIDFPRRSLQVWRLDVPSPAETLPPIPCESPSQAVRTIPCSPSPPSPLPGPNPLDSRRPGCSAERDPPPTTRVGKGTRAPLLTRLHARGARACLSSVGASSIMKTLIVEIELS